MCFTKNLPGVNLSRCLVRHEALQELLTSSPTMSASSSSSASLISLSQTSARIVGSASVRIKQSDCYKDA